MNLPADRRPRIKMSKHHSHASGVISTIGSGKRAKEAYSVTIIGMALNIVLTILKIIIGWFGKSSALVADGFHSLSDLGSDIAVLLGFRAAKKPIDECHNYGHGKFETLTTTVIGLMLIGVAVGIFLSASGNIINAIDGQSLSEPSWIALGVAAVSILTKEWMYHYTVSVGKRINSKLLIANAWHHRSDSLSSIGAFLGIGGAILLGGRWRVLDPVAALIVSLFIAKIAIGLIKESMEELLERSLDETTVDRIIKIVKGTEGVADQHKLKTRKVGHCIAIDVHVTVDAKLTVEQSHNIATKVEKNLQKKFGKETIISIHIEPSPCKG